MRSRRILILLQNLLVFDLITFKEFESSDSHLYSFRSLEERVAPAKDVVPYQGDVRESRQQAAGWTRTQEIIRLIS